MKQRILITGGAGFIGSNCAKHFLSKGYRVTVIDNLSAGSTDQLPMHHDSLKFIAADIADETILASMIKESDAILHFAAQVSVENSVADPFTTMANNELNFYCLLKLIRQLNPKVRLVYASSAAVYGNLTKTACEESNAENAIPCSPYALSKRNNETAAELFHQLYGLNATGLRFFNAYGPGQFVTANNYGVVAKFIDALLKNKTLTIHGDGEQTRDFIFVDDIAIACEKALQSNYQGVLNIATGFSITINQFVQLLEKITNKKIDRQYMPMPTGQLIHSAAKITRAKEKIDFQATIPLEQGIKTTIEWMKNNSNNEEIC